jgi:hypothetical protein
VKLEISGADEAMNQKCVRIPDFSCLVFFKDRLLQSLWIVSMMFLLQCFVAYFRAAVMIPSSLAGLSSIQILAGLALWW